jgi:5'-nucleotidase
VYNLEARKKEPVGGASRFISAANKYKDLDPLVLFSGDIYSPSKLGQTMKGKQMVPFLERFKIDVSCVGNHDLDYGVDRFIELKKMTSFPWLLTNVFDSKTKEPLAEAIDHIILDHNGIKIGIIGLAEEEWLDAIISLEEDDYIFEDFVKSGRKWCKKLREEGCELIIALTHMRLPNDKKLTQKVEDLDIVLGGHDHCTTALNINDTLLCKSGSDFREFSIIEVKTNCNEEDLSKIENDFIVNQTKKLIINCKKVEITSDIEPDAGMQEVIDGFWKELKVKMEQPAGYTGVELDARFDQIRSKETNIGNFVADVVRYVYKTDTVILNSGSLRTDELIPQGIFRWRDIDTLLPIPDPCVIIRVSGENLLKACENGVSEVPKLEGRFPCISGIRFKFDPTKPPMQRIQEITVNDQPLNKKKYYTMATKEFLYNGKDGYDDLSGSEMLIDDEDCPTINLALINFLKLMIRNNTVWFNNKKHIVNGALSLINNSGDDHVTKDENGEKLKYNFFKIYPKVDGRITDVTLSE